jgi:hypothetical protein
LIAVGRVEDMEREVIFTIRGELRKMKKGYRVVPHKGGLRSAVGADLDVATSREEGLAQLFILSQCTCLVDDPILFETLGHDAECPVVTGKI